MNAMRASRLLAVGLLSLCATARANPKDFVVYAPGVGGSPQEAKPYLDTFFRHLEKAVGWAPNSASGEYLEDPKALKEYLSTHKPGFGLMPPEMYLALACKGTQVTPFAAVIGGPSGSRYYVVARVGAFKTLDELKGKRLVSNHLSDPRFISNVVFNGKIDVEKFFVLQSTPSPVRPFKAVDRGEADAALVDDQQLAHMKTLPFGQTLTTVFSSEPMPPFVVVSFDANAKPGEREALHKAILGLCGQKDVAETCRSLSITKFGSTSAAALKPALEKYCK
jgi:hypothetical protein